MTQSTSCHKMKRPEFDPLEEYEQLVESKLSGVFSDSGPDEIQVDSNIEQDNQDS